MVYVGHRPVLPGQNANDLVHPFTGEQSDHFQNSFTIMGEQLLQDVGAPELPNHGEYSRKARGTQVMTGEFRYAPMEVTRYSHAGQNAPYLRHAHWEYHGVPAAEMFPRYSPALAAVVEGGTVTLADWRFIEGSDDGEGEVVPDVDNTFTFSVNGGSITIDGDFSDSTLDDLISEIGSQLTDGVTVGRNSAGDGVAFTSVATGVSAEVVTTAAPEISLPAETANGSDAQGSTWGHDGTRTLSTSRHSNLFHRGVPSTNMTLGGSDRAFQVRKSWDDELPTYARRHEPYINKGVQPTPLEDGGENLAHKVAFAKGNLDRAFQRTKEWQGVKSARAL